MAKVVLKVELKHPAKRHRFHNHIVTTIPQRFDLSKEEKDSLKSSPEYAKYIIVCSGDEAKNAKDAEVAKVLEEETEVIDSPDEGDK